MTLANKVVVVTGSTRGIGRAIVEGCGAAGARVVVNSRTPEMVENALRDLRAAGIECTGIAADVSKDEELERLYEHARAEMGGIDVWVNNAGVYGGYRSLDELTAEDIHHIVDTNFGATALACSMLVRHFKNSGGVILNVAGRGYQGGATPYMAVYAATKSAIVSLTRSLARENAGSPISIHALAPGMVPTDFYNDIEVSDRLRDSLGNVELALDAFGVSLDVVRRETPRLLDQEPGRASGKVYSLLTPPRMVRGIALMTWWRLTGKMVREP